MRAPPWRQAREGGGEEGQSDFPSNGRAREESVVRGGGRAAAAFVSRQPAGATNGQQVYSRCTPRAASRVPWRAKKFHVHLKVPHEKPGCDFQPSFPSAPPPLDSHPTETGHTRRCTGGEPTEATQPTNRLVLRLRRDSTMPTPAKKQSIGPVLGLNRSIHCVSREPP